MKMTGKNGRLRIYDSSTIIHGQAPLDNETVNVETTVGNITTDVEADDALYSSAFLVGSNSAVFIGSTSVFAMVQFLKGAGINYAVGSGALKTTYYNGTDFLTEPTGIVDGTSDGSDCFAQDGYISFEIPSDWAKGGHPALDSDKYYVEFKTTNNATTDPDADVLCAVDGQYFDMVFAAMDFSAPLGRAKTEEVLVLNRGNSDTCAHYIESGDGVIFDPIAITFSCLLDDICNKDYIFKALNCLDPDSDRWTAVGVTSKATTKNDDVNYNPSFQDSSKKTVNVQIIWEGSSKTVGYAYYEVFFPEAEQSISESEDGVTLNINGGCYGKIEKIHGFGVRY